jgi:predicted MFS family arabinose efflux permease
VNVPIGAVLIGAALRLLPADEPTARPSAADLDLPGAITVTGGLALLLYAISGVSSAGWASVRTLLPLAAAIVLLTAFAMIETRARRPLLRPGLLRIRGVFVGNSAMFLAGALTNCVVFFLALYLQDAHGYDPLRGGLAMVPIAVATALASLLARRIMTRIGARATLVTGALTMAAGLLWMSRFTADGTYPVQVLGPEILAGLGLGLFVMPITTAAVTGVPRADTGVAAALINASRQLGGSAGVALLATVAGTVTAYATGPRPVVLSSGYSVALMVTAGMALLTTAVAVVLPKATS